MSEWRSAMKKILNKAFASILLSSTFIVPMTSPIFANEVEIQITNADEFVNHLLSVETISDGQVTYTPFKVVDDSNYLAIINSETTYNKLTGLDTNSVVNQQMINDIDTILLKNTEKTYQAFLAEAKALQQAKEQAAQEQAAKEQAEQAAQAAQEQVTSQAQTTQDSNTSTTTQTDTAMRMSYQVRIQARKKVVRQIQINHLKSKQRIKKRRIRKHQAIKKKLPNKNKHLHLSLF